MVVLRGELAAAAGKQCLEEDISAWEGQRWVCVGRRGRVSSWGSAKPEVCVGRQKEPCCREIHINSRQLKRSTTALEVDGRACHVVECKHIEVVKEKVGGS